MTPPRVPPYVVGTVTRPRQPGPVPAVRFRDGSTTMQHPESHAWVTPPKDVAVTFTPAAGR